MAAGGTLLVVSHDLEPMRKPIDTHANSRAFDPDAYVRVEDFEAELSHSPAWDVERHERRSRIERLVEERHLVLVEPRPVGEPVRDALVVVEDGDPGHGYSDRLLATSTSCEKVAPRSRQCATNRSSIEALVTYSLQQELIPSRPALEQVFVDIDP